MGPVIVRRLLVSIPALAGVLFLCFCLLQVVPSDPARIIAGPDAKLEEVAAVRAELGLDRPILVITSAAYCAWTWGARSSPTSRSARSLKRPSDRPLN
jgi:ABC-type dipeptide/oligopeptide/nickel transport system permease component